LYKVILLFETIKAKYRLRVIMLYVKENKNNDTLKLTLKCEKDNNVKL